MRLEDYRSQKNLKENALNPEHGYLYIVDTIKLPDKKQAILFLSLSKIFYISLHSTGESPVKIINMPEYGESMDAEYIWIDNREILKVIGKPAGVFKFDSNLVLESIHDRSQYCPRLLHTGTELVPLRTSEQ